MNRIVRRILRKARALGGQARYDAIFREFKRFTMIGKWRYTANLELADRFSSVDGAIVECGTWKGGMIAGMARLLGRGRSYYLFDSFEGLPEAQAVDGEAARRWQADKTSPRYFNNCIAAEQDARTAMELAGAAHSRIEKGWFKDTLPSAEFPGGIAMLRLDADWYDSTITILDHLFKSVNAGGVMIIDDYYTWDGCTRAVHDFLSKNRCAERISAHRGVCFIQKT